MHTRLKAAVVAAGVAAGLMVAPMAARADIPDKGDVGIGGSILLGGSGDIGADPAFAFAFAPAASFFLAKGIALRTQAGAYTGVFAEAGGAKVNVHQVPLTVGVQFLFPLAGKVLGTATFDMGIGINIREDKAGNTTTKSKAKIGLAAQMGVGVLVEAMSHLFVGGGVNMQVNNIAAEAPVSAHIPVYGVQCLLTYVFPNVL